MKSNCSSCKALFDCGADNQTVPCWCVGKPIIAIKDKNQACLCQSCFDAEHKKSFAHFRLHVAYVGTNFCGYQEQEERVRTVEGELKIALRSIIGPEIKIQAAGRTDAGVHARGQVVSLVCSTRLTPRQLTLALASKLPCDLSVWRIDQIPAGFDARRHSVGKQYIYRILQGLIADPFLAKTALHVRNPLDIEAMNKAAEYFIGEHDFSSFRSSLCTAKHAKRYIWHVGVKKYGNLIEIDVRGNAFCMNMVRIMAGTLIEVGKGRRAQGDIARALIGKNRMLAGITAKPHGLTMETVYYPDDLSTAGIPKSATFPRYPVTNATWGILAEDISYGPT